MNRNGVSYDVGRELGRNWRPDFDSDVVRRELEIIRDDLHCNAVRICARDMSRIKTTAEIALDLGLEVWLSPELWNKSPARTLAYLEDASIAAQSLLERWPGKVVFCVASEMTLFMRGVIPSRSVLRRVAKLRKNPSAYIGSRVLSDFLRSSSVRVRQNFHGPVTYAALIWEKVDWGLFDIIGVDHYRDDRVKDRYVEMLKPLLAYDKPVVVTEFGMRSYVGAASSGTLGFGVVDIRSLVLHELPIIGRFVRTRLKGVQIRDEALQAREIVETLEILESTGADGAFICTFVDYLAPFDSDPTYDLDMSAISLVKVLPEGHGASYPDLNWEPKESFRAVANFFAGHVPPDEVVPRHHRPPIH